MSVQAHKATSVQKVLNQKHCTKIYNRFTGYSTQDCLCVFCLYYENKRSLCPLDKCCCLEERILARKRERN